MHMTTATLREGPVGATEPMGSSRRIVASLRALAIAAVLLMAAHPALGAGFSIFQQGSKAMGMAGAFTAQADDPSLLWHNAGGLAFVDESAYSVGATWVRSTRSDFEGDDPFPGAGVKAEQETLSEFPPHAYFVAPINASWKWGIGFETSFGLVNEQKNENTFPGRFLSTKAALRALDVNPTLGWQITPTFGIGVGAVARFSDVELDRHVAFVHPVTSQVYDVAKLEIESDIDNGYGWNVGLLHRATPSFSWGLSYRSGVEIDYEGDGRLAQISTGDPGLDALVAAGTPFDTDLPVETTIEFPDMASLGLAFSVTPALLAEIDVDWMGWSSFDEVVIAGRGPMAQAIFGPSPAQPRGTVLPQHWDDAMSYRFGLRWGPPQRQWRFGYLYDETPQPEEGLSPSLADADANGVTLGFGRGGQGLDWDLALMYLELQERSRHESFEGEPDYFGTYETAAFLLGVTLGWR